MRRRGAFRGAATIACLLLALSCRRAVDPGLEIDAAHPVRARASVDRDQATLGDPITLRIEVAHLEGIAVRLPELPETFGGLRVAASGEAPKVESLRGQVVERREVRLVADRIGAQTIPALEVTWQSEDGETGSVSTEELAVEVESLLASEQGEPTDIRDVKPLHRHRTPVSALLVAAIAVGTASVLLAAWWWWRRTRRPPAVEPPLPPYEAALQALARLRRTDFSDPEKVRAYYFALSETVRTYVEGRFALNATDLTTEEIVAGLGSIRDLSGSSARQLGELLDAADRVKFAKQHPSRRQIEETFDEALTFVESTRPVAADEREEPAPSSPGSPPGAATAETAEEGA